MKYKKDNNKEKIALSKFKTKSKLNIYIILMCIIGIFFIIIIGCSLLSQYKMPNSLSKNKLKITSNMIDLVDYTSFLIKLDETKTNQLLHDYSNKISKEEKNFTDLWLYIKDSAITFNYLGYGVPLPIKMDIKPIIDNNTIKMNYNNARVGKLEIPIPFMSKVFRKIFNDNKLNDISINAFNIPNFINIRQVYLSDDLRIILEVDHNKLNKFFKEWIIDYDKEIVDLYKRSKDKNKKIIVKSIENKSIDIDDIKLLIKDFRGNKDLLCEFLIMLSDKSIKNIFKEYNEYLSPLIQDKLLLSKGELIANQRLDSCKKILNAVYDYKKNMDIPLLQCGNFTPYDYVKQKLLTVSYIIDQYKLPISKTFAKNAQFIYDAKKSQFYLAYHISDQQVMVFHNKDYDLLERSAFEKKYKSIEYNNSIFLKEDDIDRKDIKKVLMDFWETNKLFIRYIKSDRKYAYVVASNGNNYQFFNSFLLKKINKNWEIIDMDIQDFSIINSKYPEFNITLVPSIVPNNNDFKKLSDNDIKSIVKDIYERKIIKKNDINQLVFCSYYDPYIYIMLSNGKEYIYKLTYGFLSTVYMKKDVKSIVESLPNLIFIQE